MIKHPGHYLGTEIDEKWWKRYMGRTFFARGNGEYWFEEDAFCFRKYLTKKPLKIKLSDIIDIKTGNWHSGKWYLGYPIVKIIWFKENSKLSSGFFVSKSREATSAFIEMLKTRINNRRSHL